MKKPLHILIFFLLPFSGCGNDDELKKDGKWERIEIGFDGNVFSDIAFYDQNLGYLIGNYDFSTGERGILFKTADGGDTWLKHIINYPDSDEVIYTVQVLNDSILYGAESRLYRSINQGKDWMLLDTLDGIGRGGAIGSIHFLNEKQIIITKSDKILKSYNEGHSFKVVYDGVVGLENLQFTSDKIGYVGGGVTYDATNYGQLVKTTDGGDTWQRIDNGQFKDIEAMSFLNDKLGYIFIRLHKGNIQTTLDAGASIYKTEDGGENWQLVDDQILEKYDLPRDAYFVSEEEGYFSSSKKIFHTTDGGKSWEEEASVESNEIISKLYLTPGGKGIAIGTHGLLLKQK